MSNGEIGIMRKSHATFGPLWIQISPPSYLQNNLSMSHSRTTQESYDLTAERYAHNVEGLLSFAEMKTFIGLLQKGARVLDLGCGSGRDAKAFSEKGFEVVGIDFSSELLKIAKLNAPLADFYLMDMESFLLPERSFDGVWASGSLLHIPKAHIPKTLYRIRHVLKPGGIFYLSVKKGVGEGLERDSRYGTLEKFFSYFDEEEIECYLEQSGFKVTWLLTIKEERNVSYQTHLWIRILCSALP